MSQRHAGAEQGVESHDRARPDTERELDRLSLDQALLDVDVANARAGDLTQRLITLTDQLRSALGDLAAVQAELEPLRSAHHALMEEHAELVSAHERMKGSHAFRLASRIWTVRRTLGL